MGKRIAPDSGNGVLNRNVDQVAPSKRPDPDSGDADGNRKNIDWDIEWVSFF